MHVLMSEVFLFLMSEVPLFLMSEVPLFLMSQVPLFLMSEVPARYPCTLVQGYTFRVSGFGFWIGFGVERI